MSSRDIEAAAARERGEVFRQRRQELGLTVMQAALRGSTSAERLSAIEKGETRDPRISAINPLAAAYDWPVPKILELYGIELPE